MVSNTYFLYEFHGLWYYLTGGNNSMSRFCKFGKLHVTKGNGDKLLDITATTNLTEAQP